MISTKLTRVSALMAMVLACLILNSCTEKPLIVRFNLPYNDLQLYGASDTVGGTINVTFPVNSNLEAELQKNGAKMENIKSIKIKESTFVIDSPTTANFDFLNNLYEFIGKDSVNFALIAKKEIIPQGVSTLQMETEDNDINEALKAEKFYLRVRVGRKPSQNVLMRMKASMTFEVIAEVPL
jgi:hypothetical protein